MNLMNNIFEKTFNRNKSKNFLFDIRTYGMLNKVFSPNKLNLYREMAAYNIRYRVQKLGRLGKQGELTTVLRIAASHKIKLLSSQIKILKSPEKAAKNLTKIYNIVLNSHSHRLVDLNVPLSINPASDIGRLASRSFAPRRQDIFSSSSVVRDKTFMHNKNNNYVDIQIDPEDIKHEIYNKKRELLPTDHFNNDHKPDRETVNYNKFPSYDMAIIEKYFFNMARLPPSGGTGFDPLITPVWAGVKLPN